MIQSRIVPVARNGPCALAAAMPPIVAEAPFHGSSGSVWLFAASALWISPSVTPACTWIVSSAGLYVVIRFSRVRLTAQSALCSGLPNPSCVPEPTGTMEPFSTAMASESASRVSGKTMRSGAMPSMVTVVSQKKSLHTLADLFSIGRRVLADLRTRPPRGEHL